MIDDKPEKIVEVNSLIDALTIIANHARIKKELEPNLMWHEEIKEHQTRRILYALRLFEDELCKLPESEGNGMKFDDTCKVIVETMNQNEARAFVLFLKSEIARHQLDIDNARSLCYTVINKFKLDDTREG